MTALDPSGLHKIIQETVREVLAQLRRSALVVPATLSLRDAATYIGISPSKLSRLRYSGRGPPALRIANSTIIRYRIIDLDCWLQEQCEKGQQK
jgi:hypothetical protein